MGFEPNPTAVLTRDSTPCPAVDTAKRSEQLFQPETPFFFLFLSFGLMHRQAISPEMNRVPRRRAVVEGERGGTVMAPAAASCLPQKKSIKKMRQLPARCDLLLL